MLCLTLIADDFGVLRFWEQSRPNQEKAMRAWHDPCSAAALFDQKCDEYEILIRIWCERIFMAENIRIYSNMRIFVTLWLDQNSQIWKICCATARSKWKGLMRFSCSMAEGVARLWWFWSFVKFNTPAPHPLVVGGTHWSQSRKASSPTFGEVMMCASS